MMKTIGLLGGMSWESTVVYYRLIQEDVRARLGGHASAKVVLYSVDFAEIEELQRTGRWDEAGERLGEGARRVEAGGADFLILCTNTMHVVAGHIERAIKIPMLHIAAGTGAAIRTAGLRKVGLLGTRFTMEKDFYRAHLEREFDLEVVVPEATDRDEVHRVIYEELTRGKVLDASRARYVGIVERLRSAGAEGVILGCTEIGMLVTAESLGGFPVFDTTALHAKSAVDRALGVPPTS